MKEGKPIWAESLLTPREWKENSKKYSTYSLDEPPAFFKGEFQWRYRMGGGFSEEEIRITNALIDEVLKKSRNDKSKRPTDR
jgi:hypothetical protein